MGVNVIDGNCAECGEETDVESHTELCEYCFVMLIDE
jgi:hypothetical protein